MPRHRNEHCYYCGKKGRIEFAIYYAPKDKLKKLTDPHNKIAICDKCRIENGYTKNDSRIVSINPMFREG